MMPKCGEGIKARRVTLGMTREALSDKSGVSIMTIRRYEGLERSPRFDVLEKLATAMDCTVFDFTEEREAGGGCDMTPGENIRARRKMAGITQQELADKAGLNVQTVRSYEAGKYQPKIDTLLTLAKALDCTVFDLTDKIESANRSTAMRIKELRHKQGLTQTELATMIGKTTSSIKKYEMGMTNIPLTVLDQIADALDTTRYCLLDDGDSVGERIRQFRLNKGLSQQQLGDAIGMSQQQIGQYEKGLRNPKLVTLSKFAFGLGCAVSDLLYDETEIEANQGYKIIESETYHMSDTGRADRVVLGQMVTKNSSQFVTWESAAYFQDDRPLEYFWGHYFDKEADARADYHRRLMEKYE